MTFQRVFSRSGDPYLRDHEIEGTPFVPMAVMVSEIVERLPPGVEGLSDFTVVAPIMLRKGRPRETVMRLSDGPMAFLDTSGGVFASGSPLISGSHEERRFSEKFSFAFEQPPDTTPESIPDTERRGAMESGPGSTLEPGRQIASDPRSKAPAGAKPDNPAPKARVLPSNWADLVEKAATARDFFPKDAYELFLPRESIYPSLFFHGPSLRADFTIVDMDDGAMSVILSGLSDPITDNLWNQWASSLGLRRTNPIVLDLAIQCAALEAMVTCGVFMLPRGFKSIYFAGEAFPHLRTCRVLLCQDGEGGYDCVVTGQAERPLFMIEGLRFTPLAREIPPGAAAVLGRIRDHFDLGEPETVH